MEQRRSLDAPGAAMLIGFSALLAVNQVVVKVATGGFQPLFMAGLRSFIAAFVIIAWMRYRGIALTIPRAILAPAALLGIFFSIEFIGMYTALDLTTVARASVIFYSMPVWLALAAHFLLPGERLTGQKTLGLLLAMAGIVWALMDRAPGGQASLMGDLAALLGTFGWVGLALVVRLTRVAELPAENQLLCQLVVSVPILILLSLPFGAPLRDPGWDDWAGLLFQAFAVAAAGYLLWFWLLSRYQASGVASFAFLAPVLSVIFGWLILDEQIGLNIWGALVLVALGLMLINRRPRVPGG